MALNFNPWGYVIIIGCLIVMYLIYLKIDSGLKRPKTSVGQGENGENSTFWPLQGGKRKRKLRKKPRR